jgi:cytoskeletal protein CcmA (bactofilin family)
MNIRRRTLAAVLIVIGLSTIATPAFAGAFNDTNPLGPDAFIVLTGRLDMPRSLIASDAIIFNGDATIAGDVTNNVIAVNGDVLVTGRVGENVVALNGRVTLGAGARVGGDVVSSDTAAIAPTATVVGRVRPGRSLDFNLERFTVVSRILVWLATSISSFLLGLLLILFAPRAADAAARMGIDRLGGSIGFGFLVLIGLPIAAAVAPTHRMLAFLAGWGILRLVALIPVAGFFIWLAATVWGLGALVLSARTAGRETTDATGAGVIVGGPPPVPPPPVILG